MNVVYINKGKYSRKYLAPSSFNELSQEQLLKIVPLLYSGLGVITIKLQVLLALVNFKKKDLDSVNAEQVFDMLALAEFALGKVNITKNLITTIDAGQLLHGPSDQLGNIVFIEFIKAEKHYLDFAKSGNEASLNKLIAILYRPERKDIEFKDPLFDGDKRERYNDNFVDARAKDIAGLSINIRRAIFLFYQGCREKLVSSFPELFTPPEEGKKQEGSQGWVDVLINLAGNVSAIETTGYTRLFTILATLKNKHYNNKQLEEQYKQA